MSADGFDYYDSESLIYEVEKRPALWNRTNTEFHDRTARENGWRDVCSTIIPSWNDYSAETRSRTVRDVQRKWKNIRDCFRKELNQQKRLKEKGEGKQKRRKYIFYDHLKFLIPTIQNTQKPEAPSSGEDDNDMEVAVEHNDEETEHRPSRLGDFRQKYRKHPVYSYDEPQLIEVHQEKEDIDEDKYFLLSLVPAFRKMSADRKFAAKIQFLQVMQSLASPSITRPFPKIETEEVDIE